LIETLKWSLSQPEALKLFLELDDLSPRMALFVDDNIVNAYNVYQTFASESDASQSMRTASTSDELSSSDVSLPASRAVSAASATAATPLRARKGTGTMSVRCYWYEPPPTGRSELVDEATASLAHRLIDEQLRKSK
jgi:hypothetical protein